MANQRLRRDEKSSRYKGVSWHKRSGKWQAGIRVNGRTIFLGCFADELAAARAYNRAALKYFRDFAALNLLPAEEPGDFIPWREDAA
jgi:hypothetical protein